MTRAALPSMLALASRHLADALASPPSLAGKWPFALPPRLADLLTARRGGRRSTITPRQVIQLVRAVEAGSTIKLAARQIGVGRHTARSILDGQHPASQTAAVQAAGIFLPRNALATAGTVANLVFHHQAKGTVATPTPKTPKTGGRA